MKLLSEEGLTSALEKELYRCLKSRGIIEHDSEVIRLDKDKTARFVAIPLKKCECFNVSAVTGENPDPMEG